MKISLILLIVSGIIEILIAVLTYPATLNSVISCMLGIFFLSLAFYVRDFL